jgi:beta-glucosidase-like glycosyl hydrolase
MGFKEKWVAGHIHTLHCQACTTQQIPEKMIDIIFHVDQIQAGNVTMQALDETVKAMLRTKFSLGLFEGDSSRLVPLVKLY